MSHLLEEVIKRAIKYQQTVNDRSVFPKADVIDRLSHFSVPLQSEGVDAESILAELDEFGSPATTATTGGRFFGFVIGGSLPAALAANLLADVWDQNACLRVMSPVAIMLEEIALEWLLDLFGLPPDAGGSFVTGCTMANFVGLISGRHALLAREGWDVEARGLFGAPEITVVIGAEAHVSMYRTLAMLGFGRDRVVVVEADRQGRMRPDGIPKISGPTIICIQAGNVNTGAFDPAGEICAIAHEAGAWVHVDGAFGIWAATSPSRAHLMSGVNQADSWATDGHKWLNAPYDSGLAFVRQREHLRAAFSFSASYLPSSHGREPIDFTPESSRRARGVAVWAALRTLGRQGLADLIERTCVHAKRFADGLTAAGYKVLNDVVLNQVLVSFGDEATTKRVIAGIQADGTCWCGGTIWQDRVAMRISVSSWVTTESDIEQSLAAMLRIAAKENAIG